MDISTAIDLARTTRESVLATIGTTGRPQLSNVFHQVTDDGVIRISITTSRVKYRNLVREPWAALHATADDFVAYAVLEGPVALSPVAGQPDDPTVEELIEVYRTVLGEHPDWDAYRTAMVTDQRVVVRLTPDRAYGRIPPPADS